MDALLPDFANPPVVEVALAVQFEPLTALRTPQLGFLWKDYRERFPKIEEHAPLDPMMERFGVPGPPQASVHFEMMHKPPVPRCWFLSEDDTELIQIQQDRFAHNWRKAGTDIKYTRYKRIRTTFRKELDNFAAFLAREKIGTLEPNQCEVTYVNHIISGQGWERHGEIGKVLALFETKYTEEFLPELEEGRVSGTYVIPGSDAKPLGRLRFSIAPAYRRADDKPIMVLTLVARGQPDGEGTDGVMRFLDTGREWIVRGFTALTTARMHEIWERRDDH
jgi:uncharacterized protein (TIGR04255 family)